MTEQEVASLLSRISFSVMVGGLLGIGIIFLGARLLLGKGWFKCMISDLRKAVRGPNSH